MGTVTPPTTNAEDLAALTQTLHEVEANATIIINVLATGSGGNTAALQAQIDSLTAAAAADKTTIAGLQTEMTNLNAELAAAIAAAQPPVVTPPTV